ncbi:MAG TPA: ATP-binding protein, partial [Niastella sp.]|nr:ATP-binding protein [Niastella sp.]
PCLEIWGKGTEIIGKSLLEVLPELQWQGYGELVQQIRETGQSHHAYEQQVTLVRNNRMQDVYFNWVLQPYYDKDQKEATGIITFATEVTQEVLIRMKVEESNREFRVVTDFMPHMIWLTRPDGYHYYYNKQWYDYTGLTYRETEGEGWNHVFHPEDQERAWKVWRHSLQTGEPYEIEYRCRRFDGAYRWFLGRALPLRDESGIILKWFGTCTDIDDQKRGADLMEQKVEERTRELRLMNEQLSQFTYAASHDLQEPLRKISYFLDRLLSSIGPSLNEENTHNVDRIEHTTGRMRSLIDHLLAYSNTTLGITGYKEVDLTVVVKEVLEDMEVAIKEKKATIDLKQLPELKGNQQQLRQLFQNLISNAIKYQQIGEAPHVQIYSMTVKGVDIQASIPAERRETIFHKIQVKDNGIGFRPEEAEQIFKLFQRLHSKAEYPGTGVGLAIVQKVVENHHGYIRADSEPGKGATFTIHLPAEQSL